MSGDLGGYSTRRNIERLGDIIEIALPEGAYLVEVRQSRANQTCADSGYIPVVSGATSALALSLTAALGTPLPVAFALGRLTIPGTIEGVALDDSVKCSGSGISQMEQTYPTTQRASSYYVTFGLPIKIGTRAALAVRVSGKGIRFIALPARLTDASDSPNPTIRPQFAVYDIDAKVMTNAFDLPDGALYCPEY